MITRTFEFYECEHSGDLGSYEDDVRESGGEIISSELNPRDELGTISIKFENKEKYEEFMKKFKETNAYDFIN